MISLLEMTDISLSEKLKFASFVIRLFENQYIRTESEDMGVAAATHTHTHKHTHTYTHTHTQTHTHIHTHTHTNTHTHTHTRTHTHTHTHARTHARTHAHTHTEREWNIYLPINSINVYQADNSKCIYTVLYHVCWITAAR